MDALVLEPNALVLAGTVVALIINSLAVIGIGWRGGHILGRLETTMETLTKEVHALRQTRDEHGGILVRVVGQLDALEKRVGYLEGSVRRAPR